MGRNSIMPGSIEVTIDKWRFLAQEIGDVERIPEFEADAMRLEKVTARENGFGELVGIACMGDSENEDFDAFVFPVTVEMFDEILSPRD